MQIKKIIALIVVQCFVLAVAGFGSNGLKDLFNTRMRAAEAAGTSNDLPGLTIVSSTAGDPNEQTVSMINFTPAPELPTRPPDAMGAFGGFDGSLLTLQQSFFFTNTGPEGAVVGSSDVISGTVTFGLAAGDPAQGSMVIFSSADATGGELTLVGSVEAAPVATGAISLVGAGIPAQTAPQVVLVTDKTFIYCDATPMNFTPVGGVQTIQQVLKAGSLDGLTEMVMVTVWGHMEGDQLVADVILYQILFEIQQ